MKKIFFTDVKESLSKDFMNNIRKFNTSATYKFGFDNLDAQMTLTPGTYIVGGPTSLGKTTLLQNIAQNLARQGAEVLFISIEQTTFEHEAKLISSETASNSIEATLSSLDVKKYAESNQNVSSAIDAIKNYKGTIHYCECNFNADIDDIITAIKTFIEERDVTPVVIIDYMQILTCKNATSKREETDIICKKLQSMQRDYSLIMFIVSSFNRANYSSRIDFEAFKESGGIEYSADVVMGLQLAVLNNPIFDKANQTNAKRELIQRAKAMPEREIELVCLKNRDGLSNFSAFFKYNPRLNQYYASTEEKMLTINNTNFEAVPTPIIVPSQEDTTPVLFEDMEEEELHMEFN